MTQTDSQTDDRQFEEEEEEGKASQPRVDSMM